MIGQCSFLLLFLALAFAPGSNASTVDKDLEPDTLHEIGGQIQATTRDFMGADGQVVILLPRKLGESQFMSAQFTYPFDEGGRFILEMVASDYRSNDHPDHLLLRIDAAPVQLTDATIYLTYGGIVVDAGWTHTYSLSRLDRLGTPTEINYRWRKLAPPE